MHAMHAMHALFLVGEVCNLCNHLEKALCLLPALVEFFQRKTQAVNHVVLVLQLFQYVSHTLHPTSWLALALALALELVQLLLQF